MMPAVYRTALAAFSLMILGAGGARAQAAPDRAAAAPVEVSRVGDWGVRCSAASSPTPCDMFQLLNQRKTGKRVMSISIAYMPQQNRHLIQVALPLGVSFDRGVRISAAGYNSPLLQYRRCDRNGCYVEGYVEDAIVAALARGGDSAKTTIVSDDDKRYDVAFSLKGFSGAHDTMANLARQRAGAAEPTAAAPAAEEENNPPPRRRRR